MYAHYNAGSGVIVGNRAYVDNIVFYSEWLMQRHHEIWHRTQSYWSEVVKCVFIVTHKTIDILNVLQEQSVTVPTVRSIYSCRL
jgi:hypothetical protein